MPKLKKKSYLQRQMYKRLLSRKLNKLADDENDEKSHTSQREARLQKIKENQQERLRTRAKRGIHHEREKSSQQKRLLSPTKRAVQRVRNRSSQQKRLLCPTKRAVHRERDRSSQQKRLLCPTKSAVHRERNRSSQQKRLLSPSKRAVHRERNRSSQQKRLLCPSKRAVHRERDRSSQQKRLLCPSKRAVHRERDRSSQQKRLLCPSKRAVHRERDKSSQQKRLLCPSKRAVHRERDRSSQQKRLLCPSKRAVHRERDRSSQQKRLLCPSKRAVHRERDRSSQQKRLLCPSKRAVHRERDRSSQQKRLLCPSKRAVHREPDRLSQQKRLLSPTKRAVHRELDKSSKHKNLLCPTKRALHRERDKLSHRKSLFSPTKRAVHRERQKASQRKRLRNPHKREEHLKNLRKNQNKRLRIASQKRKHLSRLRKAQEKRLRDPAGRIIHITRVLSSSVKKEHKREIDYRKNLFKNFLSEKKQGPTHICDSCHRLWFKNSIKHRNSCGLDTMILSTACGVIEDEKVRLCSSCHNSIRSKKMPTFSLGNTALCFPDIPQEIKALSELEERFVCPRIPFMSIRAAVSDKQYLVKGRAVNVPIEVPTSVSILPRTASETEVVPICFKRKKCFKSYLAFENVRPQVIKKAALLLQNSPVYQYFNIALDMQRMGDVSFQSTIDRDQNKYSEEQDNDEEDDEPLNISDDETMLMNALIFAPGEGKRPESLFAEYVEAQSFIKIYGGELIQQPKGMTYQQWVKSEIMRDDRRCAYITKIFFSALKLRLSKMASSICFCLRKAKSKKSDFSAKMILDEGTIKDLEIHDSGFRVFAADRGAPAYWELKKKELFAMMRQIGPPTIFLTLSPAETRWPELMVILKSVVDNVVIDEDMVPSLNYQEKVRLVKNDPVTVARYFEYRMRRLFNLLKQDNSVFRGNRITDYYIRTEFQQRGSPHLHCLLWLKDAPVYREGAENENVIEFIDKFITCSSLISSDSLELQTHKHTFTCKKGMKKTNRKCRFDIPFFPVLETVILSPLPEEEVNKEEQKKMRKIRNNIQEKLFELQKKQELKTTGELIRDFGLTYIEYISTIRSGLKRVTVFLKRSPHECMINFYNPELLLLHEANMDIQFITDMYSCATYILNYVNKANSGMSKLLREAATEIRQGNYSMKEQLRMLSNSFLNASEFSAQEAVYYIMALPLSSCSRHCQFVNTNPPEKRVAVVKRKSDLEQLPGNSTDIFRKNNIDHYVQRPRSLESVCLADFVAWYNFSTKEAKSVWRRKDVDCDDSSSPCSEDDSFFQLKDQSGYLRKRAKAKIIRFVNYSEHDDEHIRENVMLFWPWRDEQAMMDTAEDVYQSNRNKIKEIRAKYVFNEAILFALEEAQNRRENSDSDESNMDIETPTHLQIYQAVDSQIVQIPDEDIDKAVGPVPAPVSEYNLTLPIPKMLSDNEYSEIVSTLNSKQRNFLLHVLHLFKEEKLPLYHCVLGGAGVGKSRLITALHQTILRWLNRGGAELDTLKVLLCAPTGKAAFGIRGATLHAAFVLPLSQCAIDLVPLGCAARNTLWSKLRDVKLIIIDEISMVGSRMIQQVDSRLKQIFKTSQPFAGISLLVFGDFNQLAPVGDRYIFQSHLSSIYGEIIGNPLWDLFTSFTLTEIMRQRDDAQFAAALNNLAEGRLDQMQVKLFESRLIDPSQIPNQAIHLFRSNTEVDFFNNKKIDKDPNKVIVQAEDKVTGQPNDKVKERLLNAAMCSSAKDCQGLPFCLKLSLNIKYMVTMNLNVEDGLVNGAVGILKQIDSVSGLSVKRLWLLFPSGIGNNRRQEMRHNSEVEWTAIDRVVRIIRPSKSPHSVQRKQFPLVPAEALTIYKSQGGTYDQVAIHLDRRLRRKELYVALSRCTKLSGLYLTGHFAAPSAPSANDKVLTEIKKLSSKQVVLSCLFPSMFPTKMTIVYHNVESIRNKAHWADFKSFMKLNRPTVFIAAETWTLSDDDISIEGYNILLRLDGSRKRHAYGLVVYLKQNISANVLCTYTSEVIGKTCCLAGFVCNGFAIYTGYKPPSTPFAEVEHSFQAIVHAAKNESFKCIVLGDFNLNMNNKPLHYFYRNLESIGFRSQLHQGTSTTNASTAIDCVWSNFQHLCGVIKTLYSHHKALICVPEMPEKNFQPLALPPPEKFHIYKPSVQAPSLPSLQMSLQDAIIESKNLFTSLASKRKANDQDISKIRTLLSFVRQGVNTAHGKRASNVDLPSLISCYFIPIQTTGDGNCFYYAVSLLLCGKESLAPGLRALVAHHMEINNEFIDNLPLAIGSFTSRSDVLTSGNYAELLEVLMMSYILKRPINIYTTSGVGEIRFDPCSGRASSELHLLLDLSFQHYTALKLKNNQNPPVPDPMLNIPHLEEFVTY